MSATTELDLVHLPCDDSPITMKTVALLEIDPAECDSDYYQQREKKLRHIPDVESFQDFGWAHRTLAFLSNENMGRGVERWLEADYLLYVCVEKVPGLRRNWRVQDILTACSGKKKDAPRLFPAEAYGDAFVFTMKPRSKAVEPGRAEYTHILPSFISSATANSGTGGVEAIFDLLYSAAHPCHTKS
ncbi:hypothetical protein BDR22DRAFT_883871 [Usnea florida]